MTRLPLVDAAVAAAPVSELLTEVQRRLGATPNMTRAMANSPALLKGYLDLSAALSRGVLGAATGERIALTVAQGNACSYCLSAHSYLAEHVAHLDEDEITAAAQGSRSRPEDRGDPRLRRRG
jgi:AhpD family alkylhydroperoxidase